MNYKDALKYGCTKEQTSALLSQFKHEAQLKREAAGRTGETPDGKKTKKTAVSEQCLEVSKSKRTLSYTTTETEEHNEVIFFCFSSHDSNCLYFFFNI